MCGKHERTLMWYAAFLNFSCGDFRFRPSSFFLWFLARFGKKKSEKDNDMENGMTLGLAQNRWDECDGQARAEASTQFSSIVRPEKLSESPIQQCRTDLFWIFPVVSKLLKNCETSQNNSIFHLLQRNTIDFVIRKFMERPILAYSLDVELWIKLQNRTILSSTLSSTYNREFNGILSSPTSLVLPRPLALIFVFQTAPKFVVYLNDLI